VCHAKSLSASADDVAVVAINHGTPEFYLAVAAVVPLAIVAYVLQFRGSEVPDEFLGLVPELEEYRIRWTRYKLGTALAAGAFLGIVGSSASIVGGFMAEIASLCALYDDRSTHHEAVVTVVGLGMLGGSWIARSGAYFVAESVRRRYMNDDPGAAVAPGRATVRVSRQYSGFSVGLDLGVFTEGEAVRRLSFASPVEFHVPPGRREVIVFDLSEEPSSPLFEPFELDCIAGGFYLLTCSTTFRSWVMSVLRQPRLALSIAREPLSAPEGGKRDSGSGAREESSA
jgi:hypothetical protein